MADGNGNSNNGHSNKWQMVKKREKCLLTQIIFNISTHGYR